MTAIRKTAAVGIVLVLWAGYSALQTLFVVGVVRELWSAVLGLVPGFLGVLVLLRAGVSRQECFLAVRPLSWGGFGVLAAIFVLGLAAVLPVSRWTGWYWGALLLAPASGISQELFFRAALLPAMRMVFKNHQAAAQIIHALLFGLWHIGPLFLGAPLWGVAAVVAVAVVSGIGWGWQVTHDRTVLWAVVQHTLFWIVGLQFTLTV